MDIIEPEDSKFTDAQSGDRDGFIWVNEFTEKSAKEFSISVLKLSKRDKLKPIIIYIDSYGGVVHSLMAMLGVLDSIPNEVVTVVAGKAMSCGAVLLSHGDKRFAAPHSVVMVHEIFTGFHGNVNDAVNDMEYSKKLNKYMLGLLAKNCGKTIEKFKKIFTNEHRDIFLDPEEAVKFGIVDKVGWPKITTEQPKKITYKIE